MILHSHWPKALIVVYMVIVATCNIGCKSSPENLSDQAAMSLHKPNLMQPRHLKNPGAHSSLIVIIGASYVESWSIQEIEKMTVVNKGKSGETSTEMLNRFEQDVISLNPLAVIIWGFINDIFNAEPNEMDSTLNNSRKNLMTMIKLARANGIITMLTTELTIRSRPNWSETIANWIGKLSGRESYQDFINKYILVMNKWIKEYATTHDVILLDFHETLSDANGIRKKEYAAEDGSHISSQGYRQLTSYTQKIVVDYLSK